jgi:hypothetical protein
MEIEKEREGEGAWHYRYDYDYETVYFITLTLRILKLSFCKTLIQGCMGIDANKGSDRTAVLKREREGDALEFN